MRFVLMLLMLSGSVFSQVTPTVRVESYAEFTSPPRVVGNRIYYATESKKTEGQMGFVTLKGEADALQVDAERTVLEGSNVVTHYAEVEQIGRKEFAITGKGTYVVKVTWFKQFVDLSGGESYFKSNKLAPFSITLGMPDTPDKPDVPDVPAPDVPPDVPTDGFDNLGQRVAKWSVGLPKRLEVGEVYKKYAIRLATDQSFEIVPAFTMAGKDRLALLGDDGPKYNDITNKINAEKDKRTPMGKGVVIDFLKALARGYGVKVE